MNADYPNVPERPGYRFEFATHDRRGYRVDVLRPDGRHLAEVTGDSWDEVVANAHCAIDTITAEEAT